MHALALNIVELICVGLYVFGLTASPSNRLSHLSPIQLKDVCVTAHFRPVM
jgi:hypothetical protein